MTVAVVIAGSTVSTATEELSILIPGGKVAARRMDAMGFGVNAGGASEAVEAYTSGGQLRIARLGGLYWGASTNNTNVVFTITFEVTT
jgi:hypothetical protein